MKKLLLLLVLAISAQFVVAQSTPGQNTNVGIGKLMTDFHFKDIKGEDFSPRNLPLGEPVIVLYFDPDCDHCQMQSKWITEQKELFKGISLVFVSWAEMDDLKAFPGKHLPGITGNVFITKDDQYKIDEYFGYSEVLSIYVYNSKWVRTASFKGETKPEILVKFAKQQ